MVAKTRSSGLIVDVHAHIFNAHDVPLEEFFTRPVLHLPPLIAGLVRTLITISGFTAFLRASAPCASAEYKKLCELTDTAGVDTRLVTESQVRAAMSKSDEDFAARILPYVNREEFRASYRRSQNVERRGGLKPAVSEDAELTAEEILGQLSATPQDRGIGSNIAGVWRFLSRMAAPRHHNAFKIMDLYGGNERSPVDIFVASTVDFDASLQPSHKSTPMRSQAYLMDLISTLTNGRILPLVGYDPRRDEQTDGAALEDVVSAIADLSHLGVKLYPPMGFAPYGNKHLNGGQICEWPDVANYGSKLDARLDSLYRWAQNEAVSVLAHSSESNGITVACQQNGSPQNWDAAFAKYPNLRVCAGHFGGLSRGSDISTRMKGFVASIQNRPESQFYVDLAFLPALFHADRELGKEFADLLRQPAGRGQVADHVVFGTDWFMIAQDESERSYVANASTYLEAIGGAELRTKLMSDNPARFLNLEGYLTRLTAHTDRSTPANRQAPHWAGKLPDQP